MAVAGAAAKQMLLTAAAERFGVSVSELRAEKSRVILKSSGRSATFGELAADASRVPVPNNPPLKDPDSYTIRRSSHMRFDIPSKVNGSAVYGIDFSLPGMLSAAISLAPVYGGTLTSVDSSAVEAMPGVKRVVRLDEGVAVVADTYWHARQAVAALNPVFSDAGHGEVTSASIFAAFDTSLGTPNALPSDAANTVTADYRVPFLAHTTMEPMVCTAKVEGDRVDIWAGTQDPLNARSTAATALGIDAHQIHVTNFTLGGGFGRRLPGNLDYVGLAARIAREMSPTPIKVVWSREDDIRHDYYRPAGMARFAGALDADGKPLAIWSAYAGGGDGESTFMPYTIADKKAEARDAEHPVRTGPWRSVLNSQHGFFKESFIDEMAHAAGKDPYEFRRDLLDEQPRFKMALEKAAEMSGWGTPLPSREGRGIAITECFGSIACIVAQVAVETDGTLRVKKCFAVVDCGDVVNTDTATAQVEGGIVFGLSAALLSEITIANGAVVQSNFDDYPMIHLADAPEISVEFIRSNAPLGGLGEPAVPPVAPAVANAIFAATGIRVRELPFKNATLTA
jgi:isoquinoline 1-oxidoreductase beta subunit